MAQAFAKIHGQGLAEAYSAGSKPSGQINPRAIEAMKEIGYDLTTHDSKSLDDIPQGQFDYVVSMGCGEKCPWVPTKNRVDWDIPDPKNMDKDEFRQVRDLIETKVKELLEKIKKHERPTTAIRNLGNMLILKFLAINKIRCKLKVSTSAIGYYSYTNRYYLTL